MKKFKIIGITIPLSLKSVATEIVHIIGFLVNYQSPLVSIYFYSSCSLYFCVLIQRSPNSLQQWEKSNLFGNRSTPGIYFIMMVCLWCLSNLFTTFFMGILRVRFGVCVWAHCWRLHGDLFLNCFSLIVSGCCLICIFLISPLISS